MGEIHQKINLASCCWMLPQKSQLQQAIEISTIVHMYLGAFPG
jgi:hypothetical protein